MLSERLQILVTPEQRRRLEVEAKRRGASIASLIREAVDARFGTISRTDRLHAVERIRALSGRYLPPEELNRIVEQEREEELSARLEDAQR